MKNNILNKIKKEFPDLKWKKHKYITHGWDHDVVIFDDKIVFRTPKTAIYRKRLKSEINFLNYLKPKIKSDIPQYKYFSKDESICGYNFIKGKALTASCYKKLSLKEKNIIAKQFADFLNRLHQTPKRVIKKHNIKTENNIKLYKNLVKNSKKLIFPHLDKKDIKIIEEYLNKLGDIIKHKSPTVLIHNDLSSRNILWNSKDKKINIIDFSDRAIGDPAIDFSACFKYGPKFTKKVLELYNGEKDERILERSKLFYQAIALWVMKSTRNRPTTFEEGYKIFEDRFKK